MYRRFTLPFYLLLSIAFFGVPMSEIDAATLGFYKKLISVSVGDGSFLPEPDGQGGVAGGYYFGKGNDKRLGSLIYSGRLSLTPIGNPANGLSAFENEGRGTDQEVLHQVIYEDGSTISTRFEGQVQLVPDDQPGFFTAEWTGIWEIVEGTGRFLGARGQFKVNATNLAFNPQTDFFWNFTWNWEGVIKVPRFRFLQTGCFLGMSNRTSRRQRPPDSFVTMCELGEKKVLNHTPQRQVEHTIYPPVSRELPNFLLE